MSFRGCLSEGVDIFLKSVEHQGESGHDVRVSRLTPWMASVGGPVIMKKTYSLFVENSHPETLHRGRMFRLPWAFVDLKLPSAMSHAIHKIVSIKRCQSYFISRRSPHLGISKDSESCASAHRCLHYAYARLIARVTFHLQSLFQFLRHFLIHQHGHMVSLAHANHFIYQSIDLGRFAVHDISLHGGSGFRGQGRQDL